MKYLLMRVMSSVTLTALVTVAGAGHKF